MRRLIGLLFFLFVYGSLQASTQSEDSTQIFLLTCLPGRDALTIYGHSAIRILKTSDGLDSVYSWGVYDFNAPNFVWKFAKGRLKYRIDSESYSGFLKGYFLEQRSVISQKINLTNNEKELIIALINKNMKPENKFYLYNFFYDNCSSRVRDIIEKTIGERLLYPNEVIKDQPSFRGMINKAQKPMPWLTLGTDLLIGSSGDNKAGFRDQMFLPEDLMKNLSLTKIKDTDKIIPLLQKPETVLDFKPITLDNRILLSPLFIFCILLIIILILSIFIKQGKSIAYIDIFLFFIFSILSIFMVFFNFFTDHQAMKVNLNIFWLNPFLIIAFITLFTKNKNPIWFRILFVTSSGFLFSIAIIPQSINLAVIPIILILILRSIARSNFRFATLLRTDSMIF
ncbi:MAG: DUF4105 domain-containing protein [Bacteroidales bacterium]|jgi:hypothetical protein